MGIPNPSDPSIYENARGWLMTKTQYSQWPPIWFPVICRPTYNCGRMDLIIRPVDGIGEQVVWRTRVFFEDEKLNLCQDAPPQEQLDAYYEAQRQARIAAASDDEDEDFDGFITE